MSRTSKTKPIKTTFYTSDTGPEALAHTIRLIGQGIKSGSTYYPIHQHAAGIATKAPSKNYFEQFKAVFDDFTHNRWRYVFDPKRAEWVHVSGPAIYSNILGYAARPGERGHGDCDDATTAIGAMAESIGFETRIATVATPGKKQLFTHVFPLVNIPKHGWIAADAVTYPQHGLGYMPPHSRIAVWDLDGNLLTQSGKLPKNFKKIMTPPVVHMNGYDGYSKGANMLSGFEYANSFNDLGLDNFGLAGTDNAEPEDWSTQGPLLEFGAYTDTMPIINGDSIGLAFETDDDDIVGYADDGSELVRTKMFEMDPDDINHVRRYGQPRVGSVALGDDGAVYQWIDGDLGGFFKRLFKKAKKKIRGAVRKVKNRISSRIKKLIKKLPGGKYLLKIYGKVKRIAMKVVKPLAKFVGKFAKKLAPIAALIPGYGPVIAAALYKTGSLAQIINKVGAKIDKVTGRPIFKSGSQAKKMRHLMALEARKLKRGGKARAMRLAKGPRRRVKVNPRLLRIGSRSHAAVMRGYGVDNA